MAWLQGYAGRNIYVDSKVKINLGVDLATLEVEAFVVPDNIQNVWIIVGQPFINNENVAMIIPGYQVRLCNKNEYPSLDIDHLPIHKVNIYAKETTVIPSYHIPVYCDEKVHDVFVDLQHRNWTGEFHTIPRVITNLDACGYIPVMNPSWDDVCYKRGKVVAKGYTLTRKMAKKGYV